MPILSALIQTYAEWRRYRGTASELAPKTTTPVASESRSR
jgi:uncharacterized protein YjiS (DUF1127 family)